MASRPSDSAGIGYENLKARRDQTPVPVPPGGVLADYVPFYFGPRSPMLLANKSGLVSSNTEGQESIVHLIAHAQDVEDAGLPFAFSDGHPVITGMTSFFNDLASLEHVAWGVMRNRWWHDTDTHPDRKRRRQAEFLVRDFLPWPLIGRIAVMTEHTRDRVLECLDGSGNPPQVQVVGTEPTRLWPEGYYYR